MKKFEYYYDYTPEAFNYIMSSKLLRNRDKKILKQLKMLILLLKKYLNE